MNEKARSEKVMSLIKIVLLAILALAIGTGILFFIWEMELIPDDDVFTPVGVVIILACLAAVIIPPFTLKMRSYIPVLENLRKEKPVAYFCSFLYQTQPLIITSDSTDITFWNITKKNTLEKVQSFSKEHTDVTKGRVQVAAIRSVDGLVLIQKNKSNRRIEVNICPDKLNVIFSPKKGADLDEAIQHIKAGY